MISKLPFTVDYQLQYRKGKGGAKQVRRGRVLIPGKRTTVPCWRNSSQKKKELTESRALPDFYYAFQPAQKKKERGKF